MRVNASVPVLLIAAPGESDKMNILRRSGNDKPF
jgi:hypothetical protein